MKNKLGCCCIKYSMYFIIGLVSSYILALIIIKGNTIIANSIDNMLAGEKVEYINFIREMFILIIIGFIVAFIKSFTISEFSIKTLKYYKNLLAKKIYHLEYRFFDSHSSATLLNKVNSDIVEIESLLNENIPEICTNLITMVTYAIYVGRLNKGLLILITICYPVILFFTNKIVKRIEELKKIYKQKTDVITEISQECINGMLVLRTFGLEDYFQKKMNKAAEELVENEEKRVRISNTALIIRKMLQWLPNIICAICAYIITINGNISMGELVAFLIILQKFVDAYVGVPFNIIDACENIVCVKRIEEIFLQKNEESGIECKGIDTDIAVEFKAVSFSYTNEKDIIKDMSFKIKKNSKVAFVGESGGGKSTIFHIICGFYPIRTGKYNLLGREFSKWNIEYARENITLVSQNVFLFPSTIKDNVRYGNLNANDDDIIIACKNAQIHDFIMSLPQGYDTVVGERGILLSGGERQRISIARAFLKNAPILLLDEPTSAVDVATEQLISKAIEKLSFDRTCIIIAHRLSTIKNVDEIMVVKDGSIVEKGQLESLLGSNGVYSKIYGKEVGR